MVAFECFITRRYIGGQAFEMRTLSWDIELSLLNSLGQAMANCMEHVLSRCEYCISWNPDHNSSVHTIATKKYPTSRYPLKTPGSYFMPSTLFSGESLIAMH
jgi:hypothetical protein